jgi:site-specific DNA-cytosine methylase
MQLGIREAFAPSGRRAKRVSGVPIVDLYSGVGGFSCGAEMAGHAVKLAVDADFEAAFWHEVNHPRAEHLVRALPDPDFERWLPPPNTLWHLHGSPPCQLLSVATGNCAHPEKWREGMEQVRYYLDLAFRAAPAGWTMEQVAHPHVERLLGEWRGRHPRWIDFEVVKMEEWAIPQTRKRIIAGSPWLVQRLRDAHQPIYRRPLRSVLPEPPAKAVGIKGQNRFDTPTQMKRATAAHPAFQKRIKTRLIQKQVRSMADPAPTVMAGNTLRWVQPGGKTIRTLTLREHARIQTFPDSFRFPTRDAKLAQRLCGNSVPPELARQLMSNYAPPRALPLARFPPRPPSPSLR